MDNIITVGSSPDETNQFCDLLKSKWEITELGEPKHMLGIAITHDIENHTISLSKMAKIDQLVNKYRQQDTYSVDTPMVASIQLRQPDKSAPTPLDVIEWADQTPYHSLVSSLMYLTVVTQPDISYTVSCLFSSFDCFRPEHWQAMIWVLCYLKHWMEI